MGHINIFSFQVLWVHLYYFGKKTVKYLYTIYYFSNLSHVSSIADIMVMVRAIIMLLEIQILS